MPLHKRQRQRVTVNATKHPTLRSGLAANAGCVGSGSEPPRPSLGATVLLTSRAPLWKCRLGRTSEVGPHTFPPEDLPG